MEPVKLMPPQGLDPDTPAGPRRRRKRVMPIVAIVIVAGLTLLSILGQTCQSIRFIVDRNHCASNLRQIGLAAIMYANAHGNAFPGSMKTLLANAEMSPYALICPADQTGGKANSIPSTQPAPGSDGVSYIYVGDGVRTDTSHAENVVTAYEPLSNHQNDTNAFFSLFGGYAHEGMNVVFADAHVEWLTSAEAETILKQAAAGTRPIVYHSTASTQP